ncbi:hypothetical protein SK3146_06785 [Paenibacillus konkukensis]|uniref:Uncharacterized protein n=1 Tax=Paenibacillus konkukensis TaxID=2020716 RepID=A0ABY4RZ28_9BACL|nr:hypothetical protein SK3146_06785 [Paenibacillus konkukensis]
MVRRAERTEGGTANYGFLIFFALKVELIINTTFLGNISYLMGAEIKWIRINVLSLAL